MWPTFQLQLILDYVLDNSFLTLGTLSQVHRTWRQILLSFLPQRSWQIRKHIPDGYPHMDKIHRAIGSHACDDRLFNLWYCEVRDCPIWSISICPPCLKVLEIHKAFLPVRSNLTLQRALLLQTLLLREVDIALIDFEMCRNPALRQLIWHHCLFLHWRGESIFTSSITHLDLSNSRFHDHQLEYMLRCTPHVKTLYLFGYNFPLPISLPSLCCYGGWMTFPNGSSGQGLVEASEPGSVDRFLQEGILSKDLTVYAVAYVDVTKNHLSLQLIYKDGQEQHSSLIHWRPLLPHLLPTQSSNVADPVVYAKRQKTTS